MKNEIKKLLIKAISELTDKQRNVIVLYYFTGLTDIEIGKTLKKALKI